MHLEDYLEHETVVTEYGEVRHIRLKGHRIALELLVGEFKAGKEPREILRRFPTLTIEKVYGAISYYLHNQEALEQVFASGARIEEAYYQDYLQHGPYWLRDHTPQVA